jgi:molecular chaperone DnaK
MERVLAPVFQKAIDITKELLSRNNLNGGKLDALILVGGPTHSPILRRMLKEQITENVDTSVDPMTVVAQGAALFASTMDVEISNEGNPTNSDKIVLDLKYPTQTVEATEMVSIKVLKDKSGNLPNEIFVELKLFDGSWSTIKQVNDKKATIFDVELIPEKVNFFEINVRDGEANLLDCEQEGFTILQEFIAPSAPLPYHIGIAKYFEEIDGMRFCPIVGLEKNKELPATGGIIGFRTDKELRKGEKGDYISIPIYQGDYNAVGTELSLNNLIYEVVITGEKLPDTLPEGSIVDITIKIDESQRMYFRAYFPCLSYSEELKIEIPQEKAPSATNLADNKPGIRKGIRDALLKLPTDEEKWESVENELNENYDALTIQINRLSEDNIDKYDKAKLEDIRRMKQQIVAEKNIRKAKKLIKEINTLIIMIYPPLSFKRILLAFHFRFDSITWSNPEQARRLITIGMTLVSMGKDDEIIPIVKELFQLVLGGGGDGGTSLE